MIETRSHRIRCNGIELHVVTAGPESGRPVILLHGFPDFWYGWRYQLDALAARGLRLIIPDQRGYGLSDKPAEIAAYDITQLSADIVHLMDAMGLPRASIVGHDFGGGIAWWFAANHPDRVDRLVVLNCPHFAVYRRAHLGLEQLARSWYVYALVVPRLSVAACKLHDFRALRLLGPGGRAGGMRDEDVPAYREAWSQPGAVRGMLSWYRAMLPAMFRRFPHTKIAAPALLLWGKHDPFLASAMARPSLEPCERGELLMFDDLTHWLHWDAPERINPLIGSWLTDGEPRTPTART
ncbi:MAG TPA: alpha/beta hydrolase [Kofleriaceae bacterium]|nr:alpha/beta hydrolase [Kofleriaceae bacterium]